MSKRNNKKVASNNVSNKKEKVGQQKSFDNGVIEIKNPEDYKKIKNKTKCVIFYGAKWCPACEDLKDLYWRIGRRYKEEIQLAYCDVEACGLDFSAVPVFVSLFKGKETNNIKGADKLRLKEFIRNAKSAQ